MKKIISLLAFFLILSFSVNASCCQFKDPKNTYFELGNWDKATYFCSKMGGVTGYTSVYSTESCSNIEIPAGACDGWTTCNTNIPAPNIGSSSSKIICKESWTCNDYSSCINNLKYRSCYDINNCGTTLNKPSERESCISENNNIQDSNINAEIVNQDDYQTKDDSNSYLTQITGAAIGNNKAGFDFTAAIIILFIISLGIMFLKLRNS